MASELLPGLGAFLSLFELASQGLKGPRPKGPRPSFHKERGLGYILWSDGMADRSQLSRTCHGWLSPRDKPHCPSTLLEKHFKGCSWDGPAASSGDAVKQTVTDLASSCLRNTEACSIHQHHQGYHTHCGLWRNGDP